MSPKRRKVICVVVSRQKRVQQKNDPFEKGTFTRTDGDTDISPETIYSGKDFWGRFYQDGVGYSKR